MQALESKLNAAAQSHAALQADYDSEKARVAELQQSISAQEQSIAEAQARHAGELEALEARLAERIDYYRTALEGSEPDRAAQLAGLTQQAETEHEALEQAEKALAQAQDELAQARDASQATEAELTAKLEEAKTQAQAQAAALVAAEESHAGAMSEARGKIFSLDEALNGARAELGALQEKLNLTAADLNAKLEKSQEALAAQRAEMDAAVLAAAEEKQALEAQIEEAKGRVAALEETLAEQKAKLEKKESVLTSTKAELTAALAAAAEQKLALESQIEAAQGRSDELEQTLAAERSRAAADRQASEQTLDSVRGLYTRFAELGGKKTDRGMLLSLAEEDLRFASGMAVLPAGELPSLDRIAALLSGYPELSAFIEGHTDSAGPEEINLEMSKARADAVKQALIERGVAPERLTSEGAGESRPIAENATAAGRRQNRRVEVYVVQRAD
ncbi:MAG: hypothetical protein H6R22_1360 [Chromatiaceae bacterium]|nr:hypothetical protein [Chromatiaceae bacterium]